VSLLDASRERDVTYPCILQEDLPAIPEIFPPFAPPCDRFRVRDSFGGSFLQGAIVSYRATARAHVELGFSIAPSHDLTNESGFGFPIPLGIVVDSFPFLPTSDASVTTYHADLGLRYDLTLGDARPFVSFGIGRIDYGGYDSYQSLDGDWSLNVGAGLRLKLAERVHARVEAVDHIVTDHFLSGGTEHDVHVRIGIALRP
jgi:hypothetical protein